MKVLKWILKALAGLIAVITLLIVFSDDLEHGYNKLTWTPPLEVNGITSGMSRSDVVFKLGEPESCVEDKERCGWDDSNHTMSFRDDLVYIQDASSSYALRSIPFENTKDMKALLGDEDILGESKDFNVRRYTYLKWGATFTYKNDALVSYMVGEVTWRSTRTNGKYVVKGLVVCPSAECPFDDEGGIKEDFKDRNHTYFIK